MRGIATVWELWVVLLGLLAGQAWGQSASLLPNGMQQFSDSNGAPLVGGIVYFYFPLTTTPKNTWQDAGQTTLNTNPVILDSAGRGTIFGSGQYRQVLQDSLGNTIWDKLTAGASGTVLSGTVGQVGYYASSGNTISGSANLNISGGTLTVGQSGGATGALALASAGGNSLTIGAQNATSAYSMLLPSSVPAAGSVLSSSAGGSTPLIWTPKVIGVQTFTSSGTYTPTSGTSYVIIECFGGGGAGGSIAGDASASSGGGGGAAGNPSRAYATAATIGVSQVVTIGAGGTPGAAGNHAGGAGGNTSLGSLCIANGGGGGAGSAGGSADGGAPGAAGTGQVTGLGAPGSAVGTLPTSADAISGAGGSSPWGSGGKAVVSGSSAVNAGAAASGYAAGGSGGSANASTSTVAGGAGSPGLVIVTEY